MKCQIRQQVNDHWSDPYPVHRLFEEGFGIWSPFIVSRQVEQDFLTGLCLMYGKDPSMVLLDGRDANVTGYPPTFLQIPELSQ